MVSRYRPHYSSDGKPIIVFPRHDAQTGQASDRWLQADCHAKPDLSTAMDALRMALLQRCPAEGLIHHSDQGELYAARVYRNTLQAHGASASMSGKGNAYDNAVAESFFSNLKNELVHHCDFASREEARSAIFDNIELFYDRQRMHQTLGYVSPAQFEQMNSVC